MKFTFAFQPIVDVSSHTVFSYEALIRGPGNESAGVIISQVQPSDLCEFNSRARRDALKMAVSLGVESLLNINFTPGSLVRSDATIHDTMDAAARLGFAPRRIVVEIMESEALREHAGFVALINQFRGRGIKVAIDDFGAGYSGLNLLADFQPDMVKLDMHLIRNIESHGPRQAIVRAVAQVCFDLGIELIAEGVETITEYQWLREQQIDLYQGYLFARPGFECLPEVHYPSQ
ncbi:MAG TPA: EAL domain-containing protein [bacterium]|nr:EAL domain-containing protein [bacterium]